jgi:hypothetical protein
MGGAVEGSATTPEAREDRVEARSNVNPARIVAANINPYLVFIIRSPC